MSMIIAIVASAVLQLIVVKAQTDFTPIIETDNGPLFGSKKTYKDQTYEEYLGIPFAAPPIGPLRWQKPQPVQPWTEPLSATAFSQHCTQFIAYSYPLVGFGGESGEDCLYLNVFVPRSVASIGNDRLPVMVWIYGGSYFFGTGEQYPGQDLALHGNVVVVTFNYRVSTLGFLSTADTQIPGNYGLWDQNAALQWVQRNIALFGGDNSKVTIFGQSAGAASVSHALISPHNEGLFHNAIAISGGSTAVFALAYDPLRTAILLGDLMDCNAHSSEELRSCLMSQDPHKLDFWGIAMTTLVSGTVENLLPVIDSDYVSMHPAVAFLSGAGKDVNYITGSTYHDAAGFVIGNLLGLQQAEDAVGVAESNDTIKAFLNVILGGLANPDEMINAIVGMYPDIYSQDPVTRAQALTRALTEWWFGAPTNWEARQHYQSNGLGKTFQYVFSHRQAFLGYPSWVTASHIDDLYSVFGEPFNEVLRQRYLRHEFSQSDLDVSRKIMDYYSNFAHTGNPNEGPFQPELQWAEYTPSEQNYLRASDQFSMESFYTDNVVDRYRFWAEVFPSLVKFPPPPTFPPATDKSFENLQTAAEQRLSFTEEEIQSAIVKVKAYVREKIPRPEAQRVIERKINQYVKERQQRVAAKRRSVE